MLAAYASNKVLSAYDEQCHSAGTGGNFRRDDSTLLLKAYILCNVFVAITVMLNDLLLIMLETSFLKLFCQSESILYAFMIMQASVLLYFRKLEEHIGKGAISGLKLSCNHASANYYISHHCHKSP